MPRPASEHPTGLEHQILKVLWEAESALPVREIRQQLAEQVGLERPCVYLDLESPSDREKLSDPEHYLSFHTRISGL